LLVKATEEATPDNNQQETPDDEETEASEQESGFDLFEDLNNDFENNSKQVLRLTHTKTLRTAGVASMDKVLNNMRKNFVIDQVQDVEQPKEAEPEPVNETDQVKEADPVNESDPVKEADLVTEADPVMEADQVKDAYQVNEADPVKEVALVNEAEQVNEAVAEEAKVESVVEEESAVETETVRATELASHDAVPCERQLDAIENQQEQNVDECEQMQTNAEEPRNNE
jgi:hypothetical protein